MLLRGTGLETQEKEQTLAPSIASLASVTPEVHIKGAVQHRTPVLTHPIATGSWSLVSFAGQDPEFPGSQKHKQDCVLYSCQHSTSCSGAMCNHHKWSCPASLSSGCDHKKAAQFTVCSLARHPQVTGQLVNKQRIPVTSFIGRSI